MATEPSYTNVVTRPARDGSRPTVTNAVDVQEEARALGKLVIKVRVECIIPGIKAKGYVGCSTYEEHHAAMHVPENAVKPLFTKTYSEVEITYNINLTRQVVARLFDDFLRKHPARITNNEACVFFSADAPHLYDYLSILTHDLNCKTGQFCDIYASANNKPAPITSVIPEFHVYDRALLFSCIHDEIRLSTQANKLSKQMALAEAYREVQAKTAVVDSSIDELLLGVALWEQNFAIRKYEKLCASCVDASAVDTITFLGTTLHA